MNAHSSRSHAIMIVKIEKSYILSPDKIKEIANASKETIMNERVMTKSQLFLVDLAGSERQKKTQANAMRLEEAKKINSSLFMLGNCIQALADHKITHIPYRNSILTRLLQESLGGNAKTSLIVTISPAIYNLDETLSTLFFGSRAMKVKNKPTMNKTVDYQALSIKLQEDLDKLNDEYLKLKIDYDHVAEENAKIRNAENFLELSKYVEQQDIITASSQEGNPDMLREYEKVLLEKDNLEKSLAQVDNILYGFETEIETLKQDLKIFKDNNDKLKSIKNDLELEKASIQETVMELQSENDGLTKINKELMEKSGDANLLKIEMNKLKEFIAVLEHDKETVIQENKKLLDKINHSVMVKDEISTSLDVIKSDYQKTKDDNRAHKEKNKQLEHEKDELVKQYELIKFKNEELLRAKTEMDNLLGELGVGNQSNNVTLMESSISKKNSSLGSTLDKVKSVIKKTSSKNETFIDQKTTTLSDLKNEYLKLKSDNEELRNKIKDFESIDNSEELQLKDDQIKSQGDMISKLKEKLKSMKDDLTDVENGKTILEKTITELNIKNDQLEIEKHRVKSNLEKVISDNEISRKKLEVVKKDTLIETDNDLFPKSLIEIALDQKLISSVKDNINVFVLEKIIKNLRHECNSLQNDILEKNTEISKYMNKDLDRGKNNELLSKQIEDYEKKAKINERLKLDYQEKYEKMAETVRKVEAEKEDIVKTIRLLTIERDELRKQNEGILTSSVSTSRELNIYKEGVKKQIDELTGRVKDLDKLKTNLEQKCIEYNDKLKEIRKEKDDLQTSWKQLTVRSEELKRQNDDLTVKYSTLTKDNVTLRDNNKATSEELKTLRYEYQSVKSDLEEKCIEYNDTIKQLRQDKESSAKTIKTLQSRIDELRRANDEASSSLKSLNRTNTKTNDEVSYYKDQIDDLNMRMADSDIQNQELLEKIDKLKENMRALQTEKEGLNSTIRGLNHTIEELKEYNNDTLQNLENMSTEFNLFKQSMSVDRSELETQTDNDLVSQDLIKLALDMKVIISVEEFVDYTILEKVIKLISIDKKELEEEVSRLKSLLDRRPSIGSQNAVSIDDVEIHKLNMRIKELEAGNIDLEEAKKEVRRLSGLIEKNSEDKIILNCSIETLNAEIKKYVTESDEHKTEIKELGISHKNLVEKIKTLEIEKTDYLKQIKNLRAEVDNANKFNTAIRKDIEGLQNENFSLKTETTGSKKDIYVQTDNLSFPNKLIDIAVQSRTINSPDTYLSPVLIDKMIVNYFDKFNTISQNLADKSDQCNKLLSLQKSNRKTIEDLENYKKGVIELTSRVKDYDRLKDELNKLRSGKLIVDAEMDSKIKGIEGELENNKSRLRQINEEARDSVKIKEELLRKSAKRDTNTGVFLIKEYLAKTSNFMEDFYRILAKKDD
jgi:chromosome segregation ATPase